MLYLNYSIIIEKGMLSIYPDIIFQLLEFKSSNFTISVKTNFQSLYKIFKFNLSKNEEIISNNYYYVIPGVLNCISGEIISQHNFGKCINCSFGSYSLNIGANECIPCSDNAICFQNKISVNEGFWRSNMNSTIFHACSPNPELCL